VPHNDQRLLKFNESGTPLPVIAVALGRTRSAVESRLAALKKQIAGIDVSNISESE
jgi:biotin operon repressor